jgi:hypothetical protein
MVTNNANIGYVSVYVYVYCVWLVCRVDTYYVECTCVVLISI